MIPSVSVLIPVRDAEPYVEAAVLSILRQSFTDFEVLIIDDGSTDRTPDICAKLAGRDKRIRLLDNTGVGISASLNQGIEVARGSLLARMDADDLAYPDRFAIQCKFLAEHPEVVVVGGRVRTIGPLDERLGEWRCATTSIEVAARMEWHCAIAHPTVVMRAEAIQRLGGYRAALDGAEDYDLWLRVIDAGGLIDNVPEFVLDHRIHDTSVSGSQRSRQRVADLAGKVSHRLRQEGISHTFVDTGSRVDSAHMWAEVPHELCIDLRLRWALWRRDGLVDDSGWDLDTVTEALMAAHRDHRSSDRVYAAFRQLAADARGRRDWRALRWYRLQFNSDPARTVRQFLRSARRRSVSQRG
jgi:glycosyltransferase involved in cell wall biosynthesis